MKKSNYPQRLERLGSQWGYGSAAPQKPQKPLTDEEINNILMEQKGNLNAAWFLVFARAIERHHGVGEKE